jgi:hypothetical protein
VRQCSRALIRRDAHLKDLQRAHPIDRSLLEIAEKGEQMRLVADICQRVRQRARSRLTDGIGATVNRCPVCCELRAAMTKIGISPVYSITSPRGMGPSRAACVVRLFQSCITRPPSTLRAWPVM